MSTLPPWAPAPARINYIGADIQAYTITQTDTYDITVVGGQGGGGGNGRYAAAFGGYGALVSGEVFLESGTILGIVAGGGGVGDDGLSVGGCGGGGSFVWIVSEPKSTPIPEPSTWALMALGFAGLGFAGWRSRHRNSPSSPEGPFPVAA